MDKDDLKRFGSSSYSSRHEFDERAVSGYKGAMRITMGWQIDDEELYASSASRKQRRKAEKDSTNKLKAVDDTHSTTIYYHSCERVFGCLAKMWSRVYVV